ncbi:hypothetical protein [Streptomyces sp. NPDC050263]|uniref:hypothetical protein n=1 Tax=Streptomyces sp. NPDC050263 TaxID=3155037 RepID=UPI00343CC527
MLWGVFILAGLLALAVRYVWLAVRVWREPERAPDAALSLSTRIGIGGGWALTRGVVVLAAHWVFMAIAVIAATVGEGASGDGRPAEPWMVIALSGAAGVLSCWLLMVPIAIFNRPRFLVVPYLRDRRRL